MVADFFSWALVMAMPGPDIISIGLQTSCMVCVQGSGQLSALRWEWQCGQCSR